MKITSAQSAAPHTTAPQRHRIAIYSIFLTILLCLLLSLAVWAGRWGFAGIHSYPAHLLLDSREREPSPASSTTVPKNKETWNAAMTALAKAIKLAPGSAELFVLQGQMYHHRALNYPPRSLAAQTQRQNAIKAYQQALQLRPAWGHAWILLAQVLVQSGDSASKATDALLRAITLAPWSGEVQTTGVRLGLVLWPLLTDPQRRPVYTLIRAAFPRHGGTILPQALQYQQLELIEPLLINNPLWRPLYKKLTRNR